MSSKYTVKNNPPNPFNKTDGTKWSVKMTGFKKIIKSNLPVLCSVLCKEVFRMHIHTFDWYNKTRQCTVIVLKGVLHSPVKGWLTKNGGIAKSIGGLYNPSNYNSNRNTHIQYVTFINNSAKNNTLVSAGSSAICLISSSNFFFVFVSISTLNQITF